MFDFFRPFIDGVLSPILEAFFAFTVLIKIPSYAIAIVLFTIVIRLLLSPLGWNQTVSMRKMREIQPIQARLQKKYGQRKEVYQQKIMELYKRRKVNPMAGCFPLLVQLPIMMCFYLMLLNHNYGNGPEAYFFGFELSKTYPFAVTDWQTYIWPVLVAGSFFLSTKLAMPFSGAGAKKAEDAAQGTKNAKNTKNAKGKKAGRPQATETERPRDPMQGQQKFMNIFMSGFMAVIMTMIPSGMGLYFITYNAMQLLQTIVINKILDMRKKKEDELKRAKAVEGEA
jgi:YidC/Oxa1 family membrane protein insertase